MVYTFNMKKNTKCMHTLQYISLVYVQFNPKNTKHAKQIIKRLMKENIFNDKYLPNPLKKDVSFLAVCCEVRLNRAANDARDCGDTDTTTVTRFSVALA